MLEQQKNKKLIELHLWLQLVKHDSWQKPVFRWCGIRLEKLKSGVNHYLHSQKRHRQGLIPSVHPLRAPIWTILTSLQKRSQDQKKLPQIIHSKIEQKKLPWAHRHESHQKVQSSKLNKHRLKIPRRWARTVSKFHKEISQSWDDRPSKENPIERFLESLLTKIGKHS